MKKIELTGKCSIVINKSADGLNNIIIHQLHDDGTVTPIYDAPITIVQENPNIGIEFTLDVEKSFCNK